MPDGTMAKGNHALVKWAVTIARGLGREPDEARALLDIARVRA